MSSQPASPIPPVDQEKSIVEEDSQPENMEDDDSLMIFDGQQALVNILDRARQDEIQQLTQSILSQQPVNDTTARFILSQWNFPSVQDATPSIASHSTEQQQYPPLIQSGVVADHHRPYAAYGHLDRATIAE